MISFSAPAYAITETIQVRSPEIGETVDATKKILVHRSRAGTVRTIIQDSDIGLQMEKIELSIVLSKQSQADELREFILKFKSDYIMYTDYDGVEWVCIYNDDTLAISPKGRSTFDVHMIFDRWKYA